MKTISEVVEYLEKQLKLNEEAIQLYRNLDFDDKKIKLIAFSVYGGAMIEILDFINEKED